jgi:hypothetical protein
MHVMGTGRGARGNMFGEKGKREECKTKTKPKQNKNTEKKVRRLR